MSTEPKRVLVIEDEPEMRRNIVQLLKFEGFAATAAEDGETGLQRIREQRPDLVICDVMMPRLDGHAVLQAVRSDPALRAIPFIFLTAKGAKSDQRGGMNLGADDYLTKPVENEDLVAAVKARLQRASETLREGFAPDFTSSVPLEQLGLEPVMHLRGSAGEVR